MHTHISRLLWMHFECEYIHGDLRLNGPIDAKWIKVAELKDFPLPKATHKIIEKLIL